ARPRARSGSSSPSARRFSTRKRSTATPRTRRSSDPEKGCQTPFSWKLVSDTLFLKNGARHQFPRLPASSKPPCDPAGRVDQPVLEKPLAREARVAAPPRVG